MSVRYDTYAVPRADLAQAFYEYEPSLDGFVATQVLPLFGVQKKAATMSVVTREGLLKRADVKHKKGASSGIVNVELEDLAYECLPKVLRGRVFDEDRANFKSDFDAELAVMSSVQTKLLNEQEIDVATLLFNTTTWTGTPLYTDNSSYPWSTTTTTVIKQVAAAAEKVRQNTGVRPDSLLIGAESLANLLANTTILARFPGASLVTEQMIRSNLAAIFGLQNLFVGGKTYDSAKEGQSYSGSDIWSKTYAMVFKLQNGNDLTRPGLGRTLNWEAEVPENMAVEIYRDGDEDLKADVIRCSQYRDELIFDKYFAHLMKIEA